MKSFIKILFSTLTLMTISVFPTMSEVKVTEETKDAAYDAPASKLIGKWYEEEKGEDTDILIFKANGLMDRQAKIYVEGINVILTGHYRYSKKGNTITLTPFPLANRVTWTVAPESKTDFANLSNRRKEIFNQQMADVKKALINDSKNTESIPLYYLTKDHMVIGSRNKLLQSLEAKTTYESEAWYKGRDAREKAEKEARAEAQAKAEAEAKAKAEAEAEAKAKAEAEAKLLIIDDPELDELAEFDGGTQALMKFLYQNIRFPEEAIMNDIYGKVVITIVIETDGSIEYAWVDQSVDPILDKEALRVVHKMPKWKPAKKNGQPVRSAQNIPFNFASQVSH